MVRRMVKCYLVLKCYDMTLHCIMHFQMEARAVWSRAKKHNWAPSSEFVSSSISSWQISTAHAQPFRGASDLAFCLKVPLDSLLVWASSGGSGETARMRRLAWTFAARIGYKYQIRLTRSNWYSLKTRCKTKCLLIISLFAWWSWSI